ncbi:hypothetical protein ACYOEI_31965, partial [Singulisphaera rosea]
QEPGKARGRTGRPEVRRPETRRPEVRHRRLSSLNLGFHDHLDKAIEGLKKQAGPDPQKKTTYNEANDPYGRKALLLDRALEHYQTHYKNTSTMTATQLTNQDEFAITNGHDPSYFSNALDSSHIAHYQTSSDRYNYDTSKDKEMQFWVDFANKELGGGVFNTGFVQEETMCLEMPEMANAAALPSRPVVRTGVKPGVLDGSPTPWVFEKVRRVMHIHERASDKDKWRTMPVAELKAADEELQQPFTINILAMAAPRLSKTEPKASQAIVKDLFNTFVAGFTLAKEQAKGEPVLIHTGPIGAGDFNNDKSAVFVIQRMAALTVGKVNLKFWAYSDQEARDANVKYYDPIMSEFHDPKAKTTDRSLIRLLNIAAQHMSGL